MSKCLYHIRLAGKNGIPQVPRVPKLIFSKWDNDFFGSELRVCYLTITWPMNISTNIALFYNLRTWIESLWSADSECPKSKNGHRLGVCHFYPASLIYCMMQCKQTDGWRINPLCRPQNFFDLNKPALLVYCFFLLTVALFWWFGTT
jgi:hypothetical protein